MKSGSFILPLRDANDVKQFGGKAVNLARMLQADFPVPDGFAIGLDSFTAQGSLYENAKQKIHKLLKPNTFYAVRSSAMAEDAENASWAGQFETFLNIPSNDILSKVEECHNSTKVRAKAYGRNISSDHHFDIAVIVQEMLTPMYAGVLFTKDPVSGNEILVTEYVKGLGEELVSGRADPNRISWVPGDVVDAPFSIDMLSTLAEKVKQLFGMPQDIEWVWAENNIWLV